ncbi:MAG: short-chain dehydrogenase [Caedibacter sp. 37-49]|nr:MAG: short-chain dehydrogenase [Caedibacter sp. 37-49]
MSDVDHNHFGRVYKKVALVTGGASGIGEATCLELSKEGAKVAVTDINKERGESVVKQITASGGVATFFSMDITDESAVESTIKEVVAAWGSIDILVNNAGVPGANKPTDKVTVEEWDYGLGLNTKGVFLCTKHSVPFMKEQRKGGSIINVSSVFGVIGSGGVSPYHAAKGAIRAMTKNDAVTYGVHGIRVNSVHPSSVRTPMTHEYADNYPGGIEKFYEDIGKMHPLGRVAEPLEIAKAIVFLASNDASFITGAELMVDGGFTAK